MLRHYPFIATGRKHSENSHIHTIEFLELGLSIVPARLLPADAAKLEAGFAEFLQQDVVKKEILAKLEELDEDNEEINPLSDLEIRKKYELGPHDRLEVSNVEFKSKRRSSCCERILPPVMKVTLVTELLLYIPILSAAIGNSEIQLFGLNPNTAKSFGTTQGALFMLYNIINTFAGPGANTMGQVGFIFDRAFHTCWRFLCCSNTKEQISKTIDSCCNRVKRWFSKGGMTLFCLGYLLSDFLMNFAQYQSMEQMVDQMAPGTYFPKNVVLYSMLINFYLNQINDPIYGFSFLYYMFKKFDAIFSPKLITKDKDVVNDDVHVVNIVASKDAEEKSQATYMKSNDGKDNDNGEKDTLKTHLLENKSTETEDPKCTCWSRFSARFFNSSKVKPNVNKVISSLRP